MSISLDQINAHLDSLAIPARSLGNWRRLATHLCTVEQSVAPEVRPAELLVFAADHGFAIGGIAAAARGASTVIMEQTAIGGAASAIVAESFGIGRRVVDVGVARPARFQHPSLANRCSSLVSQDGSDERVDFSRRLSGENPVASGKGQVRRLSVE